MQHNCSSMKVQPNGVVDFLMDIIVLGCVHFFWLIFLFVDLDSFIASISLQFGFFFWIIFFFVLLSLAICLLV
jgi:hypothetical protein